MFTERQLLSVAETYSWHTHKRLAILNDITFEPIKQKADCYVISSDNHCVGRFKGSGAVGQCNANAHPISGENRSAQNVRYEAARARRPRSFRAPLSHRSGIAHRAIGVHATSSKSGMQLGAINSAATKHVQIR